MPKVVDSHHTARPVALLCVCAWVVGCTTAAQKETPKAEAEALYVSALEQMHGNGLLEAQQDLQKALKLPAYLTVTPLVRLRLGDVLFLQGKYDEAIDIYGSYVSRHDGSVNVPYAAFMTARAYYEMIPSDLWILPPIREMDLSPARQARYQLESFIRRFPLSRFVAEAQKMRDHCIELEVSQDAYVVAFYAERGRWLGVVFRLHRTLKRHPSRTHTAANYALLGQAYEKLAWRQRAIAVSEAILLRWPKDAATAPARARIARLAAFIDAAKRRGQSAEMPTEVPPTAAFHPEQESDALLDRG